MFDCMVVISIYQYYFDYFLRKWFLINKIVVLEENIFVFSGCDKMFVIIESGLDLFL